MELYPTTKLKALRGFFQRHPERFDIRFVGGCVRDRLAGKEAKDVDLCTDATPEQQIEIYRANGITYHATGLQHGTLTVVLAPEEVYEITSLRGETDHDGRHATVFYHRDWNQDLARRDLTINAMMLDFDGNVYDPFGGVDDLHEERVCFVGNPDLRMREDYLRILRWIRFQGRFSRRPITEDKATCNAAVRNREGLRGISRERVWMEMKRIVVGPRAGWMLNAMQQMGLDEVCDLPRGAWNTVVRLDGEVTDPVAIMVAYLIDPKVVRKLTEDWKWSRDEADRAMWLAERMPFGDEDLKRIIAVERVAKDTVRSLAFLQGRQQTARDLFSWPVPTFPVNGRDLLAQGMKPGPQVGETINALKEAWHQSEYLATKEELLASVRP